MIRPKSCTVCGARTPDGASRCPAHKVGSARKRPCLVCSRPSQGNYCPLHEPEVDEALRNERNPYRRAYKDPQYAKHRLYRYERAHGKCESCGIQVGAGEWDCDHLIPLSKGGTNAVENLRILCRPCHLSKTRRERKQ